MRVLTAHFLSRYPDRVLNIHPSLLPAFPGVDAQRQAWEHGVTVAGCTVHLVDDSLDGGAIVLQAAVPRIAVDQGGVNLDKLTPGEPIARVSDSD